VPDVSIFEIHLHDASFTANAPNSGVAPSDDEPEVATADTEPGGPTALPKLLALGGVALVVLVLVLLGRRLVGGESETVPV
jgi:hypothetical protein